MEIFKTARIKLTSYYVAILAAVLLLFSAVIFQIGVNEIERSYAMAILRNRKIEFSEELRGNPIRKVDFGEIKLNPIEEAEYLADVTLAKKFLFHNILMASLGIVFVTSFLAYFLVGKNLRPIEEMVEQQKDFISDAAHELRTPITAIQTSLEVSLKDKKMKKDEAIEVLSANLEDIKDLKNLSEQLLTLAVYEEASQVLNKSEVKLTILADELLENFKLRAKEKKISLFKNVDDEIVSIDQEKIKQLISILLDNAIKYSPSKSKIKLLMKKDKNDLTIQVKDQGMGIAADDLDHIFDRFYKSDKARQKDKTRSFGLGLAIAKKIAVAHKAQITVGSKVKKGSTFTVKLAI